MIWGNLICHVYIHVYIKVQLTPKIFFRLYKSFCRFDHCCEKIIVVAIFVNFLWFFKVPKFGRFRAPWPSSSEEWGELACDVIEGLTKFCWWGKCMRRCDSVIQKCVVGGRNGAESSGERHILSSIPLSRWHSFRNEKKAAEVCWLVRSRTETGNHRAVLGSWVRRYCKNLEIFMACILFSTF